MSKNKVKVDSDFRKEFDQEYANVNYATKSIIKKILIVVIVLSIIGAIGGVGYRYWRVNTDRMIFKQSVTYNEGMLDDLAKYKLEMVKAEDDIEKAAIAELVNSRYANFDASKIENTDLKKFLSDCQNGKYITEKVEE